MNRAFREVALHIRTKIQELLLLVMLAAAAGLLTTAFPANRDFGAAASSWREKNREIWWQAHQLFGRDPEQLSASQRRDVERWCRCIHLLSLYKSNGLQALTDDECRQVTETLSDIWPNLEECDGYFTFTRPAGNGSLNRGKKVPIHRWMIFKALFFGPEKEMR